MANTTQTERVVTLVTKKSLKALDRKASTAGMTRSAYVRLLIDRDLQEGQEA